MILEKIRSVFEANRNAAEAVWMKKYMKNQFEFLGIKKPRRQELLPAILHDPFMHAATAESIGPLILQLWNLPEREYQYLAMTLLEKRIKKAGPGTAELLEQLIVIKSWWDTVDAIAAGMVGPLFLSYPELIRLYVPKWMNSGNMWLQRSAILFQLKYKNRTDEKLMFDCMSKLAGSKEFFIRKAIGWALREYGKTNPSAVLGFVARQPLSPLSYREATRRIL